MKVLRREVKQKGNVLELSRRKFLSHVTKCLVLEKLQQVDFVQVTGPRLPDDRFDSCDGVSNFPVKEPYRRFKILCVALLIPIINKRN